VKEYLLPEDEREKKKEREQEWFSLL